MLLNQMQNHPTMRQVGHLRIILLFQDIVSWLAEILAPLFWSSSVCFS